jgi:hypothetical protein
MKIKYELIVSGNMFSEEFRYGYTDYADALNAYHNKCQDMAGFLSAFDERGDCTVIISIVSHGKKMRGITMCI